MQTVRHDGRETAYRAPRGDEGSPVLYVHGSGGSHRVWVEQYGRRAHAAVALDLSGHGASDDVATEPGTGTLDAYADDVAAVARETGARVLCGNSLGGAVVQHVALDRDLPLDALVLCGTGAKLGVAEPLRDLLASDLDAVVDALHVEDMLFHDPDPAYVEQSAAAMRDAGRAVVERDFLTCHRFDVRDRLGSVDVPALAITGEHDGLTPVSYHEYLADHLPRGDLAVVEDAAHLSFLERPDAWNAAVDAFLAETVR